MEVKKINYILRYFSKHMTENEALAWKHWSSYYKVDHSDLTVEQKHTRIKVLTARGWLSSDPDVLELLSEGIDKFKENTAMRIFTDHPEVLDFNNCPKCGELARTPFAKQCRYCKHDWH